MWALVIEGCLIVLANRYNMVPDEQQLLRWAGVAKCTLRRRRRREMILYNLMVVVDCKLQDQNIGGTPQSTDVLIVA